MSSLLRIIREHPDAVEADLSQYHQRDYLDRWRFDERGRRLLTLRKIAVLARHLPPDSAVARTEHDWTPWTLNEHLLDDIRLTVLASIPTDPKKPGPKLDPYPGRPGTKKTAKRQTDPERVRRMNEALVRYEERKRKIESGEIPTPDAR